MDSIKFDIALDLIANKISGINMEQDNYEELNSLMVDREKIYNGDVNTIDKVISLYGKKNS